MTARAAFRWACRDGRTENADARSDAEDRSDGVGLVEGSGKGATADLFAATVRHAQQHGQLRTDVSAEAAGRLLLDAYLGALLRWAAEDSLDMGSLSDEFTYTVDITMNGLRPSTG